MGGLSAAFRIDGGCVDTVTVGRLTEAISHRGAQTTCWIDGPVGLAHRRSPSSLADEQPAVDWTRCLRIVMNGRLYNHDELKRMLAADGVTVSPDNQLEAIMSAYRVWGPDLTRRLDGDFAFVLHDAERGCVLCVRDALGVKPLYYAFDGRCFLAASEQKQLLAAGVSADPSEERIAAYLSAKPFLAGGSGTFFRDVRRLEPGQWLLVDRHGLRQQTYWCLDPQRRIAETSEEGMAQEVRRLLTDSVRRRVPAMPPYACALSGGFDSSSVAALYRRVLDSQGRRDPLETFSFEFRDPDADEPELIRAVSAEIGARHHSVYLDHENVFDVLPELLGAGDEPTCDMGLLMLWRKKQAARALGVSVLLSGLGGDELFLGRLHYFADLLRRGRISTLCRELRSFYPCDRSTGRRTQLTTLFVDYAVSPLLPRGVKHFLGRRLLGRSPVGPWIHPQLARRTSLNDRIRTGPSRVYDDRYRQYCYDVFAYELLALTLPVHDALNAAFALDTRFPLLDQRLVEYLFAVPREQKIANGHVRILQRKAMDGVLPEVVLREHLKKNFHPAMERQQRAHFLAEIEDLLRRERPLSGDYVDWKWLRSGYRQYVNGGGWYPLWFVLNLERWLEGLAGKTSSGRGLR